MDPSAINQLVRTGEDNLINKYYSASVATILIYDYLLTLDNEIRYAWVGGKTWMFYLFIVNRYSPLANKTLGVVAHYFSVEMYVNRKLAAHGLITSVRCKRAISAQLFFFVLSSLLAQVFISIRAYALSRLNQKLLWAFVILGAVHVGIGFIFIYDGTDRVVHTHDIPLDPFKVCLYDHNKIIGIAFEVSILVFDTVALVAIVTEVSKYVKHFALPSMLRAIISDATIYFFTIFLSHLLLVVTMEAARPGLKILPAIGLEVLMPVMTSRLVLSLKEVADKTKSMNERSLTTMSFATSFSTRESDLDLDLDVPIYDRTLPLGARRRTVNPDRDAE